jgi:recombination protein RecA
VVGSRTRVKIVKNKTAAPFREAEFDMMYGEGISREGDLIDLAVSQNLVEKSGSWFSYKGERVGQGRENAKTFLKENKDIAAKIEVEVRKALGLISSADKAQAAAANAEAAPSPQPKPPAGRK